ncbi:MAG: hypothetical protein K2P85_06530, partial [Flavobacteriaceae bacterium]|nr:hypothetical protein [Flavobacteriaceae bacterium]
MKKKMKNSLCIISFYLFSLTAFSQNNVIEYKAVVNKSNVLGSETLESYPNLESNLKLIKLSLI